jgi:hypothetical protein
MTGVAQKKADRLRVMNEIYSDAGDNTMDHVDLWEIRERLGFGDEEMGVIVDYLEGERLIEALRTMAGQRTPMRATITHRGVKEMERSEELPAQPTDHFPPRAGTIINVSGDMIGSAIQSNSAGATQHVDMGDITIGTEIDEQIRRFLDEFDAQLSALQPEQTANALAEIAADVATVRAQLNSPKPKKNFIKESLASIRAVLENGVGGVVTVGLLVLIGMIHL